jgi:hypothetical protein
LRAQTCSRAVAQSRKLGVQVNAIGDVGVERFLGGDLLLVPVGDDRALVDAGRARFDVGDITAEYRSEHCIAREPQVAQGADADALQVRRRLLADPVQLGCRQWIEQCSNFVLTHDHQSIGLAQIGGDLGHEPIRRHTDRCRYSRARDDLLLDRDGDRRRVAERGLTFSYIEERFVERQALHERCVLVKHAEYRARHFLVAVEARRDADRMRTAA